VTVADNHSAYYYTEPDNRLSQPAYDLLDASAGWTSDGTGAGVRVWTSNILNKHVTDFLFTSAYGYLESYSSNPPRVVGITVSYKF